MTKTTRLTNRITSVILSMLMLASMVVLPQSAVVTHASAQTVAQALSGEHLTEAPEGYKEVRTVEDLDNIRLAPDDDYILMNDLDLSGTAEGGEWDFGNGWRAISFNGNFDGNGYTISNMNIFRDFTISRSGNTEINDGLFENANTISNLHLKDVNIIYNITAPYTKRYNVDLDLRCGCICAVKGDVFKCSVDGDLSVEYNCSDNTSDARVYDNLYISGITNDGTASECYCGLNITSGGKNKSDSSELFLFDLGGITARGNADNCYFSGTLNDSFTCSSQSMGHYVSGGAAYGKSTNCIDFGSGLTNWVYKRGGYHRTKSTSVSNCYAVGYSETGVTEINANSMKRQSTFADLDFENVWEMGDGRPQLKNNPEALPSQVKIKTAPTNVNFYKGDEFDVDGTLEAVYASGNTASVPITKDMISGYDMNKLGTQNILINYRGFSLNYAITVNEKPVTDITLDTSEVKLEKGENLFLNANVSPIDATDQTLTYASSDESVVIVDDYGLLTAVGGGTAVITVSSKNGVKAECSVTVTVAAEGISLDQTEAVINRGETITLIPALTPTDSSDEITWTSSDDSIASVDENGVVTAAAVGEATITATTESGVSASCAVNVIVKAKKIWFPSNKIDLAIGETKRMKLNVNPEDTTETITFGHDGGTVRAESSEEYATVLITGLSEGEGKVAAYSESGLSAECTINVTKADIANAEVDLEYTEVYFDGQLKTPAITVTFGNMFLVNGVDYTAEYTGNRAVGTAKITLTGAGNFVGTKEVTFEIVEKPKIRLKNCDITLSQDKYTYDGTEKEPDVTITYDGETLLKNTDYTVEYMNNKNVGTATVVLRGNGDFEGTVLTTFEIVENDKSDISNCTVTLDNTTYYYDGTAKKPEVTVTDGEKTLRINVDYMVTYSNNIEIGTGTVTISGIRDYSGTTTQDFEIIQNPDMNIEEYTVTLSQTNYVYDGTEKRPTVAVAKGDVKLRENVDYTIAYTNNINIGTATVSVTGKGNYFGMTTATFTIAEAVEQKNILDCTVTLSKPAYVFDGQPKKPSVSVKDGTKQLYEGVDYTVTYSDNTSVGTAKVLITGKGSYMGTKNVGFEIKSAAAVNVSNCVVTLQQTAFTYTGKEIRPNLVVKYGNAVLIEKSDYTASYSNNINAGIGTVTITGIGGYTGTNSVNFMINAPVYTKSPFVWGTDNWNFINYDDTKQAPSSGFSSGTYRSQINETYKKKLKENLTNSEYQSIFIGSPFYGAWLDEEWGGSCYGMSATTLFAKQGLVPYSGYQTGATCLHDLNKPTSNSNVSSLITYYQMLQVKDVIQQKYRTVPKRSHETNIKEILSLLDKNDTVLVGFQKDGWGGHAILAYDHEYGSWTKNGVSYGGRIKICDPNSADTDNEDCYIYFNPTTYAWAIPAYNGITSAKGAVFNYIGADISEINEGGYLSGNIGNNTESFVARIDAFEISDNRSVAKVQVGENGNYNTMNTAAGDIEEEYSYILMGESKGVAGYNLRDAEAAYKVTQGVADNMELAMTYANCTMIGSSKAGESVLFDKNGYVEVKGQSAEYALAITMDGDHPTDWFSITVSGKSADNASIRQVDNGWVLTSDNLKNVEVIANNKYEKAETTFSTEYPSALIYEIDENTIGIAVDQDSNGTYETILDTKTSVNNIDYAPDTTSTDTDSSTDTSKDTTTDSDKHSDTDTQSKAIGNLGDLDDDNSITANDALMILRQSVGLAEFTPTKMKLADIDGDTSVTANDALAVLRYSVGLSDDKKINAPVYSQ